MITKFNKFNLITEDPDIIYYNGKAYDFQNDDAIPFFIGLNPDHTLDEIYVGKSGNWHSDIDYSGRVNKAYPGRLFTDGKIMAFWVYPNEKLFVSIIKSLENKLNIKIFNNNWMIEVIKKYDGDINTKSYDNEYDKDKYYFGVDEKNQGTLEIIPIEEYAGSEDVSEEKQIMHLMNWKEKDLAMKAGKFHFKNFGSFKSGWDAPHNIKYRQAIYQENKKH